MEITAGTALGIAGLCVLCVVLELVLILGLGFAKTPGLKRGIGRACTIVIWILTIVWAALLVVCCMAALDYLKAGDTGSALKLGVTAIILVVGIYVLFLRYYIKKVRRPK